MNQKYILIVDLFIKGPFISSGGTDATRGIDRIFARNSRSTIVLNGSHVKGKLCEAVSELQTLGQIPDICISEAFGEEGLKCGSFHISDFYCQTSGLPGTTVKKRVAIDTKTGTAKEQNLQFIENLFASDLTSIWRGEIAFISGSEQEANTIAGQLNCFLKWITAFGAVKGSALDDWFRS